MRTFSGRCRDGAIALLLLVWPLVGCSEGIRVGGPSIEGTYRLMARDLPDGSRLEPPDVGGMLTYAGKFRHMNVYWTDAGGQIASINMVSEYELVDKRYWEQSIFYMSNNEIDGSGMTYDLTRPGGASPVWIGNKGLISFELPLFDEPSVVFANGGLTATREGGFVDHWVKVK
jgi:hypothetical protein